MLTGSGKVLEAFIRNRYGVKVRSVELNVSQRCSGMLASAADVSEAARAGEAGVKAALRGETGKMIAFLRKDSPVYELEYVPQDVNAICNKEKKFPAEWITDHGRDVSGEFLAYALPLIQGEVERKMENGLPVYLYQRDGRPVRG